jgi:hypothetical protein
MQSTLLAPTVRTVRNRLRPSASTVLERALLVYQMRTVHSESIDEKRPLISTTRLANYPTAEILGAYVSYWYARRNRHNHVFALPPEQANIDRDYRDATRLVLAALTQRAQHASVTGDFATFVATMHPAAAALFTREMYTDALRSFEHARTDDLGLFTADLYTAANCDMSLERSAYLRRRLPYAVPQLTPAQIELGCAIALNWRDTLPELLSTVRNLSEAPALGATNE